MDNLHYGDNIVILCGNEVASNFIDGQTLKFSKIEHYSQAEYFTLIDPREISTVVENKVYFPGIFNNVCSQIKSKYCNEVNQVREQNEKREQEKEQKRGRKIRNNDSVIFKRQTPHYEKKQYTFQCLVALTKNRIIKLQSQTQLQQPIMKNGLVSYPCSRIVLMDLFSPGKLFTSGKTKISIIWKINKIFDKSFIITNKRVGRAWSVKNSQLKFCRSLELPAPISFAHLDTLIKVQKFKDFLANVYLNGASLITLIAMLIVSFLQWKNNCDSVRNNEINESKIENEINETEIIESNETNEQNEIIEQNETEIIEFDKENINTSDELFYVV